MMIPISKPTTLSHQLTSDSVLSERGGKPLWNDWWSRGQMSACPQCSNTLAKRETNNYKFMPELIWLCLWRKLLVVQPQRGERGGEVNHPQEKLIAPRFCRGGDWGRELVKVLLLLGRHKWWTHRKWAGTCAGCRWRCWCCCSSSCRPPLDTSTCFWTTQK